MHNNRSLGGVLAAAVASTGFAVAPMPTIADTLTCTSASFTASADSQGNIVVNCTQPGGTPVCTLTASPTSLPATGGAVTLTADNCGTISSWTKAGTTVSQQTSTSWQDQIGANAGTSPALFTYTVNGTASASVTITEAAPSSTAPPPGPISCPGYTTTLVYDLPWTAVSKITSKGFGNNAIVVARFTTPATSVVSGSATIAMAEWTPPITTRTAAVSTSPCDLTGQGTGAVSPGLYQTASWTYQINGTVTRLSGRIVLQPSTTYYVNVVNKNSTGAWTCSASTCDIIVQLTLPTGL